MMRKGLALVVLAVAVGHAPPAGAYEHRGTHRWLTRQAAELLVARYPGRYDELLVYLDDVAAGAEHEDDYFLDGDTDPTTLRVQRHFFRPTDGAGLAMDGRQFPSSFEWAVIGSEQNEWDWGDGLRAYGAGDKQAAYFALGHVVHLVQDLTVPAHVHLDVHGPPAGDDYEGWCTARTFDEYEADLPLPPAGAPLPVFGSPLEAWQATAEAAYWRNLYPGELGDSEAHGVIVAMFPDLHQAWSSGAWTIDDPDVGALGDGFFEREPGLFYFKTTAHPAAVDVAGDGYAPNDAGAPMAELMARDLVPIAILHSAAVMKLYLDDAYALPPVDAPMPEPAPEPAAAGCRAGGASTSLAAALLLMLLVCSRRTSPCAAR